MEVFGLISAFVMPWIVKGLTSRIKGLGGLPVLAHRVAIIRAVVAVLGLLGACLSVYVGDLADIDGGVVETAVLAVYNAGVATWLYYGEKLERKG